MSRRQEFKPQEAPAPQRDAAGGVAIALVVLTWALVLAAVAAWCMGRPGVSLVCAGAVALLLRTLGAMAGGGK